MPRELRIDAVPHDIHSNFLDLVGKDYAADHVKGLAEWLKNSSDAYTREDVPDADQVIFLILDSKPFRFACLDFVGMTREDIEKAFKRWGDPDAASRGLEGKPIWGGHGNGGKFYMRQMFRTSHFITYRDGRLNVFGFDTKKRYGYARGFENVTRSPEEAARFAKLEDYELEPSAKERIRSGNFRFTLVLGDSPERMRGKNGPTYIWKRLTRHPQARRILATKRVYAIVDRKAPFRLLPPEIPPKPGYADPFTYRVPDSLPWNGETVQLSSPRFPRGTLVLRTSEDPFNRYAENHAIDFFGSHTCVATYRISELGPFRHPTVVEFLYGECHLPILESKVIGCIRNDRQKLVENEVTEAVLDWVRKQVDDAGERLEGAVQHERLTRNLAQSAVFNDYLNQWQRGFMTKLWADTFGGNEQSPDDRRLPPRDPKPDQHNAVNPEPEPTSVQKQEPDPTRRRELGGEGTTPQKVSRYPQVLLSGYHPDPSDPQGQSLQLNPRHPPIYQRRQDQMMGVYWINTESPFAKEIQDVYGVDSTRWREYLFLRRIDIMVKQSIYQRARQEPKLTADIVDLTIDDVQRRVFEAATHELKAYLFEPPSRIGVVQKTLDEEHGE